MEREGIRNTELHEGAELHGGIIIFSLRNFIYAMQSVENMEHTNDKIQINRQNGSKIFHKHDRMTFKGSLP